MHRYRKIERLALVSGAVLAGVIYIAAVGVFWLEYFIPQADLRLRGIVLSWTGITLLSAFLAFLIAGRWIRLAVVLAVALGVALLTLLVLPDEGYEVGFQRIFIGSFIPPIISGLCFGAFRRFVKAAPQSHV
jgi:hypothetical protein